MPSINEKAGEDSTLKNPEEVTWLRDQKDIDGIQTQEDPEGNSLSQEIKGLKKMKGRQNDRRNGYERIDETVMRKIHGKTDKSQGD